MKIWDYTRGVDRAQLKQTIHTSHRSNIFCADFHPCSDHIIVSCAADGSLNKNDVNNIHGEERLMKCQGLMHGFIFDIDQPQVVYTAEDSGTGRISRIDMRTNIVERLFDTRSLNYRKAPSGFTSRPLTSIKSIVQSPMLGSGQLLIGGKGLSIGLLDTRCLPTTSGGSTTQRDDDDDEDDDFNPHSSNWRGRDHSYTDSKWPFVQMWGPHYPHHSTGRSAINPEYFRNEAIFDNTEISISGLQLSKDGHTILASYQGDQIYLFDLLGTAASGSYPTARCVPVKEPPASEYSGISGLSGATSSSSSSISSKVKPAQSLLKLSNEKSTVLRQTVDHGYCLDPANGCPQQGALSMLGGHINYATFLKNVSFFGPRDEYVISGSDSGHLWVWTTASGSLDTLCPEDRTCRVVNVLKADSHTCNGVVPHPIAPVLASYGIDRYLRSSTNPHLHPLPTLTLRLPLAHYQ